MKALSAKENLSQLVLYSGVLTAETLSKVAWHLSVARIALLSGVR